MQNLLVSNKNFTAGELAGALAKGLLAGLAGTVAITLSQMIEMKITGRKPGDAPVKVASQVTGVNPPANTNKEVLNNGVHFAYGTSWGAVRGLLDFAGIKGIPATLMHFGAIWATELIMLPQYNAAQPVTRQKPKSIAIDVLHHAVYAVAAGIAFKMLNARKKREKDLKELNQHIKGLDFYGY
jgi:hypothetical protein